MRTYASTMVNDSGEFCKSVLIDNIPINKLKDTNNQRLTDKHLCESVGKYLNLPVYDLYKKVCDFVHFSSASFHNITKAGENYDITMYISRENRMEDKQEFERLSLELANQFYFFGSLLIEEFFASWLEQIIHEKAN